MPDKEPNGLEYLSGAFKGLSAKKKDHVLDVARSLLEVQNNKDYHTNSETASCAEREELPETSLAYAGEKI